VIVTDWNVDIHLEGLRNTTKEVFSEYKSQIVTIKFSVNKHNVVRFTLYGWQQCYVNTDLCYTLPEVWTFIKSCVVITEI
jgi:hypothetical protein